MVRLFWSVRQLDFTVFLSADFWLSVLLLAGIPCAMAAYGGFVAADSITEEKKRRRARRWFLGFAIVWIIVAICYQYRVSNSEKETEAWQQGVSKKLDVIKNNPSYSPYQKQEVEKVRAQIRRGPTNKPNEEPDLVAFVVNPQNPQLDFFPRYAVAEKVEADPVLWDIDREDGKTDSLIIQQMKYDWIRPDQHGGPTPLIDSRDEGSIVKKGDRIFGYIQVACPTCQKIKLYWVYFVYGDGGRFAEISGPPYPNPKAIAANIPDMKKLGPDGFLNAIAGWVPIGRGP